MTRKGPQISERTWNTLRRYGLRDRYDEDAHVCLKKIQATLRENRDPELIHALAELSYVEGKIAESAGAESDALGHFGVALTNSYDYLFSPELSETRNQYDPQFRATCGVAAVPSVGAWRSLAARSVRDAEVGGSNPLAPTKPTCVTTGLRLRG